MLLRKIKSILRPKITDPELPFDLNKADLARLKEIRSHPHWDTYLSLLDKLNSFLAEDMLNASTTDTVMFYRSYILGLRRAGTIVDEIIKSQEAKDVQHREREQANRWLRDESTVAATFGTPYWG